MKLRNRSAWLCTAGLAVALSAVACDSGSADAKQPEATAEAKAAAEKAATEKAVADKAAEDKAAADKAAAEAKVAEEAKAAADAKAAEEEKAATDARLAGFDGKALYDAKCKTCHAADGRGTKAMQKNKVPDMADAAWQSRHDQAKITEAIAEGVKDSKMKPFKGKLKPEEIEAISVYVKTMK